MEFLELRHVRLGRLPELTLKLGVQLASLGEFLLGEAHLFEFALGQRQFLANLRRFGKRRLELLLRKLIALRRVLLHRLLPRLEIALRLVALVHDGGEFAFHLRQRRGERFGFVGETRLATLGRLEVRPLARGDDHRQERRRRNARRECLLPCRNLIQKLNRQRFGVQRRDIRLGLGIGILGDDRRRLLRLGGDGGFREGRRGGRKRISATGGGADEDGGGGGAGGGHGAVDGVIRDGARGAARRASHPSPRCPRAQSSPYAPKRKAPRTSARAREERKGKKGKERVRGCVARETRREGRAGARTGFARTRRLAAGKGNDTRAAAPARSARYFFFRCR